MQIIFDTNFLIYTVKYKISYMEELNRVCYFKFELCVLDKTIEELKKINNPESRIAAYLIRDFKVMDSKRFKDTHVDDILVKIADKNTVIATQDKELIKKLKAKRIPIIMVRQKKYYSLSN